MRSLPMIARTVIAKSVIWRILEVVGSEAIAFGCFVVLARLLIPEDFGVVSQATLLVLTAQMILQQGLPEALVQKQDLGAAHFDTALWANLALASLAMAALMVGADLAATALDEPDLAEVLRWLAPTLVVFAASRIILAKLRRELRFQGFMLMSVTAALVGAVVGISLATAGYGVWSLVAQQWVVAVVGLGVGWLYSGWLPQLRFVWQHVREFWAFSAYTVLDALLVFCARRLDLLILGLFWPATQVGYYFLAQRLLLSAGALTYYSIGQLGLPILAQLTADRAAYRTAIDRTFRLVSLACMPTLVGLALVARLLIPLLFGDEWASSIGPFQVLCTFSIFYALALMSGQMLLSAGYARDTMVLSALSVVVFLLAISLAAPHGVTEAAFAAGVANMLVLPVYLKRLRYRFGFSLRRFLKGQIPVWSATLSMAVAVLWCQQALASSLAAVSLLAISTAVGSGVFVLVMVVLVPAEVREIYSTFVGMRQGEHV